MRGIFFTTTIAPLTWIAFVGAACGQTTEFENAPASTRGFLEDNCYDCHTGDSADAGLDLEQLSDELTRANAHKWARIFDRVRDGEMPPPNEADLDTDDQQAFLEQTGNWIGSVQDKQAKRFGRVGARRLTNLQLERTLHDLLGINIPLASQMPEEPRTGGFTTVASGQSMSHFQLNTHVNVVDRALDNAFKRAFTSSNPGRKRLSAKKLAREKKKGYSRQPELVNKLAVTWNSRLVFHGRLPETSAPIDGWYRFTINAKALKIPEGRNGVWCTIRSGKCIASAPLMTWIGSFEAQKGFKEITVDAWLTEGDMLEIRPGDATLKRVFYKKGTAPAGVGAAANVPGVAIKSISMQRIEPGLDNDAVRDLLFAKEKVRFGSSSSGKVKPDDPYKSLKSLLYRFAKKAFRRPIEKEAILPYLKIAGQRYEDTGNFVSALRVGYRAILCSPRFMYFYETPGQLDDFAIASRMSYLLWNRGLDGELWGLAAKGKLSDPTVIKKQVQRMLEDPRGRQFVVDFADQWLDMNQIDFTDPDKRLYPGFDRIVEKSMLDETHSFLQHMIDKDISVSHLIDSDYTFLNSRLAHYYGISSVQGDQLQKVRLSPGSQRGGLLTHGSVLKVTSNGNNTSPVIRGVWISEKLLGEHIPPPPENVPAIEPDVRGAKSIREQLAKHKSNEDCASCHRKIDPPGFALENFDPSGRWRDHYGKKNKKNSKKRVINAGFEMSDGEKFDDLSQFKKLVLRDQSKLARSFAEKLIVYGTGGTIQFSDRDDIQACVEKAARRGYGLKTLIKEVVASKLFQTK